MSRRILIKIGGGATGEGDTTIADLAWLQGEGYLPIVVHGGGAAVTTWLDRLGTPTRFVDGLRVTSEESIDVVIAVLAGLANKRLTDAINAAGGRAVGLSGADGPIAYARVKDEALGLVGEIERIDPEPLDCLLSGGFLPVVAPIGCLAGEEGPTGTLLNINADTMAAAVGAALGADQFIFLTDVPGVLGADGALIPGLTAGEARGLIHDGVIAGGMIPKAEACLRALEGVEESFILDGRSPGILRHAVSGDVRGTRIT